MSGLPATSAVTVAAAAAAVARSRRRASSGVPGPLGSRLAAWVPPAPRSTATRVAVRLWAAPITLAGVVAGLGSGARPRVREGVLLFSPARGITGWLVRRRGFAAAGLGHVVISLQDPPPALFAHELTHVRQAERLGPFMAPTYLGLLAVHGYARHPMEQAARLAAAAIRRK